MGDEHAGKSGACPKCKGPIEIPKTEDEVVIHAPEMEAGAVDSKGRSVLKPLKRKEAKLQLNTTLIVVGACLLSVAVAFLAGRSELSDDAQWWTLAVGAALLGPPLAYAGYSFLRDDELDAYRGLDVVLRSVGCGLAFAVTWGLYVYLASQIFGDDAFREDGLSFVQMGGLLIGMTGIGALASLVAFDLDFVTGALNFALYLGVCIILRLVMGLPLLPGMISGA